MKKTIVTCDMCGKNITYANTKYKFKQYRNSYANYEDFECLKWNKMDMCEECYERLEHYIPHHIDIERILDKVRYLCGVEGDKLVLDKEDLNILERRLKGEE